MSLKAFHVFFVIVSTLCALGFGAWAIGDYLRTGNTGVLALPNLTTFEHHSGMPGT